MSSAPGVSGTVPGPPPGPFRYDSLESMAVMVKVKPNAGGTFDAEIVKDPTKANIIEAIAQYVTDPTRDLGASPISLGGSSKGGKSKKARRTKGGKSKKARKGKSLRRK
jgi:hypothetical protein